jgi:serine/threonine-protein kinase
VFDFGRDEEGYYIAQEYILGRDVAALVETSVEKLGAPLEPGVVVTLTIEALKALGYAHNKHDDAGRPMALVHRDVSPSNLMVSAQGELKLLDFGIVKADNRATQTQAGVVKGNVFFMSPEQARGLPVDGRSDLFSLGMVMFFALTGRTLYSGESNYDLLIRAAEGPRPQDLERLFNVPAQLAEVVKRAIDVNPDRRFATAGEFQAALHGLPAEPASGIQALMITLFRDDLQAERERFSGASA